MPTPPPHDTPRLTDAERRDRADRFHEAFYHARLWERVSWLGVPAYKCPLDLWVYQEILHETRPDVIVETGTAHGGSALYLASVCDAMGHGRVVTIDTRELPGRRAHPRVAYITGSSIDAPVADRVRGLIGPGVRAMVILDSIHSREHVLAELRLWAPLVAPGCFLIVEDTNINGHPVHTDYAPDRSEGGAGAFEAVREFLRTTGDFEVDRAREKFLLTFNPGGYLRRVR